MRLRTYHVRGTLAATTTLIPWPLGLEVTDVDYDELPVDVTVQSTAPAFAPATAALSAVQDTPYQLWQWREPPQVAVVDDRDGRAA
jgi:hypothetical protein